MSIIPIFTSHFSLGGSVLSLDLVKDNEIRESEPVSIFSLAAAASLKQLYLLETSLASFPTAYKNCKKNNLQLVYGYRVNICDDLGKVRNKDFSSVSSINLWMKDSNGYRDLLPLFNEANTTNYIDGTPYLTWSSLKSKFTKHLICSVPFYSSFLFHNNYNKRKCVPDFGSVRPYFHVENHGLIYDDNLQSHVKIFLGDSTQQILPSHSIYYYKNAHVIALQLVKCCHERSFSHGDKYTIENPNLENFSSDQFSFESFVNLTK